MEYKTVREISQLLRCSPVHLRKLVIAGDIPAIRLGKKKLLFVEADVVSAVDRMAQPPQPK